MAGPYNFDDPGPTEDQYLAGLFDADGCHTAPYKIVVANNQAALLEPFQRAFGGSINWYGREGCYGQWVLCAGRQSALQELAPWLIVKGEGRGPWGPPYLAGFLDGDGSVCVCRYGYPSKVFYVRPELSAANRCLRVLELFKERYEGSFSRPLQGRGCWRWQLFGWKRVLPALEELAPYLLGYKAERARHILEHHLECRRGSTEASRREFKRTVNSLKGGTR